MKKSRLSLAAITALGITTASLSANNLIDIKLTDGDWKFIGVNGAFASSGSGSSSKISETVNDNSFTYDGTFVNTGLMVIDHNGSSEPTKATMTIYTDGHAYDSTAMPPEMYVYLDSNSTSDIRIKYQSDFEGESFFIETENGTLKGTFNVSSTSSNPQQLVDPSLSETSIGLEIADIFDRNLSNNPGYAGQTGAKKDYSKSSNQDALLTGSSTDDNLSVYHYNSIEKKWDIYKDDSSNNDFTALKAGQGYWVKFQNASATDEAGLILGTGGISSSSYNSSNLSDGWNMLSFDDSQVRSGATGLILELNTTTSRLACSFIIEDSQGTDSITIVTGLTAHPTNADSNNSYIIKNINSQISNAIKNGSLSSNFNIKAYPSAASDAKFALISDRKFRVKDTGVGTSSSIISVTTLGGNAPYDVSSATRTAITNLGTTSVESVFGEYVLATKLNSSASFPLQGVLKGKVKINDNTAISLTNGASTLVEYGDDIIGDADIDFNITIDTDFDGTLDTLLLVNDNENFYIRDNTWTKVYKVENNTSDGEDVVIDVNQSDNYVTIAIAALGAANDNNATSIGNKGVTAIAAVSGTMASVSTDINITGDSSTEYIYLTTNNENYKNLALEEVAGDTRFVEVFNSTEDNASGTIKEVYTLENLAQATVQDSVFTLTFGTIYRGDSGAADTNNSKVTFVSGGTIYTTNMGIDMFVTGSTANLETALTGTDYGVTYDINITQAGAELNISLDKREDNTTLTATEAATLYTSAFNTFAIAKSLPILATSSSSTVTLTGDINISSVLGSTTLEWGHVATKTQAGGNLTITPVTENLQYNPVYASGLVTSETPVQTLTSAGYKVSKILSTNENSSGAISWNFVDLTKDADTWFNEEDQYNLFSFDKEKGYWVYLTSETSTELSDFATVTPKLTTTWAHKFNNDVNNSTSSNNLLVTNAMSNAILSVDVSNVLGTIDRVVANVGSNEVRLTKSGNNYSASFSTYDLSTLSSSDINVTISAFDKTGHMATTSVNLDNSAPTTPTVTFADNGKTVTLNSASTDAKQVYIYSGDINESSPMIGGNFEGNVSNNIASNICSLADSFGSNLGAFKFVAVDGTGDMDYSRVSSIGYLGSSATSTFYPIYKNASILAVTTDTTGDSNATIYDSSCATSTSSSTTGVAITGINDANLTLAYERNGTKALGDLGISQIDEVTISVDSTEVAKIQFDNQNYVNAGQKVLFQYNGSIYYTNWKALNEDADSAVNFTDSNKTDSVTGIAIIK